MSHVKTISAVPFLAVLDDSRSVWADDRAKSVSYFCKGTLAGVDSRLIAQLKERSDNLKGEKSVRLCLHRGPHESFHDMVILDHSRGYFRPHKHLDKGETYHLIEGAMAIFVFDEGGVVVETCVLAEGGCFLFRVGADTFHGIMPLSERVIYHESKPGPFRGEGDSIFPSWAPDEKNPEEVARYKKKMLVFFSDRNRP